MRFCAGNESRTRPNEKEFAASFLDFFHGRNLMTTNPEEIPADARATRTIRGDAAKVMGEPEIH